MNLDVKENTEVVEDYKYVGVLFKYNGSLRKGRLELKEQATGTMYVVIRKARKFDFPLTYKWNFSVPC